MTQRQHVNPLIDVRIVFKPLTLKFKTYDSECYLLEESDILDYTSIGIRYISSPDLMNILSDK